MARINENWNPKFKVAKLKVFKNCWCVIVHVVQNGYASWKIENQSCPVFPQKNRNQGAAHGNSK